MKRLAAFLLLTLPALAAIDGTVINRTTGKPQSGVEVNLIKLAQGMEPAGSAKTGPDGKFHIEASAQDPYLLQAHHQGVAYNIQLPPGSAATPIEVPVFDVTTKPLDAVDEHILLVETDGQEVVVHEALIYKNAGTLTWADPNRGTLRFYAPSAAGDQIKVRAVAPGGMPVERAPKQAGEKDVWQVDYPVKPGGETRFDISYKLPAANPLKFATRILHAAGPVRLLLPKGIKPEGAGIKEMGVEPSTQAMIYDVTTKALNLTLTGTGQVNSLQPTERSEDDGPTIEQIQPPGFDRNKYWILGLMLSILAVSFIAQYARGAAGKR